jgi:hypothetical protein
VPNLAWSIHYSHAVPAPKGFPPADSNLSLLADLAGKIAPAFRSRLIVANFIRDRRRGWHFLEAGSGAVVGTGHEGVFKYVAERIRGELTRLVPDAVGDTFG